MANRILVVGAGEASKSELMKHAMREKYGDDVELVTYEEAKAQGLTPQGK